MKSLHKKMAVGLLSAALVVGVGASASHAALIPEMIKSGNKLGVKVNPKKLPFKSQIQVRYNSKLRARNNAEIIFGFRDIFNYEIWSINGVRSIEDKYIKSKQSFKSAHDFIENVSKHGIKEGHHLVKIENQEFILQFRDDIGRGFNWILDFYDNYQHGLDVLLKSMGAELKY